MNIRLGISEYDPASHYFIGPKGKKKVSPLKERCLMYLITRRNKTVSKEAIWKAVWGNKKFKMAGLYVLICGLKRILRTDPNLSIDNKRSYGYGLKDAGVKDSR
jgi:DNA-binding winged helix-turn-helix (wHTH) protein